MIQVSKETYLKKCPCNFSKATFLVSNIRVIPNFIHA